MLRPDVGFEMFSITPIIAEEKIKFVPPKLRNGSGWPVVGKSPVQTQV